MDSRLAEALQHQLDRWQLFAPCLGANATVMADGLGCWNGASGFADADTKDAMPVDGSFYISSSTKTYTAIGISARVGRCGAKRGNMNPPPFSGDPP